MNYGCNLEAKEALFSRGIIDYNSQDEVIETPSKAIPIKRINTSEKRIDPTTRGVAEIYQEIDSAKLAEFDQYNSGCGDKSEKPGFIHRLEEKLEFGADSELTFSFFAYTDAREINRRDMERYVNLSKQFSDVIIQPLQVTLLRAILGSLGNDELPDDVELPKNVYRAYKNGIRLFCEEAAEEDMPIMGVIPLFKNYPRMRDHIDIYEEEQYDIQGMCIDFRNCTPTGDDYIPVLRKFMGNMGTRRTFEDRFLYALNPRSTSSHPDEGCYAAEDFCLAAMGFDIIGESHIGWGGSDSEGVPTIKQFWRDDAIYQKRKITKLWTDFPHSGLDPEQFEGSGRSANQLRRLYNSEQLELALRDLRSAIEDGRGFDFVRSKHGVTPENLQNIQKLANAYFSGDSKDVSEYSV